MAFIALLLEIHDRDTTHLPTKAKLSQLDAVGTSVFIPGTVCLLLALQWGGLEYAVSHCLSPSLHGIFGLANLLYLQWSNGRIIALLVLGCILLIAFVLVQIFMPDTATVPPRIFVQRSIMAGFYSTFCIGT